MYLLLENFDPGELAKDLNICVLATSRLLFSYELGYKIRGEWISDLVYAIKYLSLLIFFSYDVKPSGF